MTYDPNHPPEPRDPVQLAENIGQLLRENDVVRARVHDDERTVGLLIDAHDRASELARKPGARPAAADVQNDVAGALQEASERLKTVHHLSTPDQ